MRFWGGLAFVAALAVPCGVAHADDGQFLADLGAAGVPILAGPQAAIAAGHTICGQIRNGAAPEAVAGSFGMMNAFGPPAVIVAQTDLCPDTLPH